MLLAAVAAPLGGLALRSPAPAPVVAATVGDVEPVQVHPTIAVAPVRLVPARATRSRTTTWARPVPGAINSP